LIVNRYTETLVIVVRMVDEDKYGRSERGKETVIGLYSGFEF